MNTFKRTKIINWIEYVYEITPNYDPETKKWYEGTWKRWLWITARFSIQKLPKNNANYSKYFMLCEFYLNDPDRTKPENLKPDIYVPVRKSVLFIASDLKSLYS